MKNETEFQIRSYGWQELALLYNPGITPNAALKRLRKWIEFNPALKEELLSLGWKNRIYILTPLQVTAIIKYLGTP